jgi:hypothetical protein
MGFLFLSLPMGGLWMEGFCGYYFLFFFGKGRGVVGVGFKDL